MLDTLTDTPKIISVIIYLTTIPSPHVIAVTKVTLTLNSDLGASQLFVMLKVILFVIISLNIVLLFVNVMYVFWSLSFSSSGKDTALKPGPVTIIKEKLAGCSQSHKVRKTEY